MGHQVLGHNRRLGFGGGVDQAGAKRRGRAGRSIFAGKRHQGESGEDGVCSSSAAISVAESLATAASASADMTRKRDGAESMFMALAVRL